MKKVFCSILFITFLFSVQVAFSDTILISVAESPYIPVIKGKNSNKVQEIQIANFDYAELLKGDISSASIEGQWGGKTIWNISKLDLYLDDILLIDFDQYYKGLSRSEKKALRVALRHRETIQFNIPIDQDDLADLKDGQADLKLVGKPKFFRNLHLEDTTLTIDDPADPIHPVLEPVHPVPEPATMLLFGSGLVGLWGYRKKFRK